MKRLCSQLMHKSTSEWNVGVILTTPCLGAKLSVSRWLVWRGCPFTCPGGYSSLGLQFAQATQLIQSQECEDFYLLWNMPIFILYMDKRPLIYPSPLFSSLIFSIPSCVLPWKNSDVSEILCIFVHTCGLWLRFMLWAVLSTVGSCRRQCYGTTNLTAGILSMNSESKSCSPG